MLGEKGGWKILLQRVEHFLFSTGINRQSELLLTYLQAPSRRPKEKMVSGSSDFNEHRTRLEAALLVPEGHHEGATGASGGYPDIGGLH